MSKPLNIKRVAIVTFILLLALAFASEFGPGSRASSVQELSDELVARVGNKTISLNDVRNAINPEMEPFLRNPELASLVEGYFLNILDKLVDDALLEQQAPLQSIAISNAELLERLQQEPAFQENGQFHPDTYQRVVQANTGLGTVAYEKTLRAHISRYKLQQFLNHLGYVSKEETEAEYRQNAHKAELRFVRFSPAQLASQLAAPTPQELAKFMEENANALQETYAQNSQEYREPARQRLRQIFVERPAAPDAGATDALPPESAHQKAQALLTSLQQGADFESLARESSEDAQTQALGGDLGWVEAHQLPPLLANTVLNMQVGETSSLLETPRGYFIYRLEERQEAHAKPFEAVQEEMARSLWAKQKSEQLALAQAQKALAELLNGQPLDALFPAAPVELGSLSATLTQKPIDDRPVAVSTGLFGANDASIPKLGEHAELKNRIFQMPSPGPVPEVQTLGTDLLVMELIERQHPSDAEFEQTQAELQETLQKSKAQQTLPELVQHLKASQHLQLFPEKLQKFSGAAL